MAGCMLWALNRKAAGRAGKAFAKRHVKKLYLALVEGHVAGARVTTHTVRYGDRGQGARKSTHAVCLRTRLRAATCIAARIRLEVVVLPRGQLGPCKLTGPCVCGPVAGMLVHVSLSC